MKKYIYNHYVGLLIFIKELAKIKYTFVLVGNHDRINNKVFLTEEHSLIGLKNQKNINIVDKVFKFKHFLFVPYVEPGRFQEALDTLSFDMSEVKAIFAHQEFYGAQMKSIKSEIGDKWLESQAPIFSGHIHSYQQVQANIFYIGTPYQLNFGESEDKALALLNVTSDSFNIERIYLNYIKKKTLIIKADDLEKIELAKDIMWRLIIEDDVKYIKKILSQSHIKEKIKDCQINFKITQEKKIERKDNFICSFNDLLEANLNTLSSEEREFYSSMVSDSSLS